jgi:signal transduction histidine kinase
VTVFAVQWVLAVAAWPILPYYTPVVGIMVALYAVSVHRHWSLSLLALLASFVPYGLDAAIVFMAHSNFSAGLRASIFVALYFYFVAAGVWGWGRVTRSSHQRIKKVENERDEAKEAVTEQRKRLARELHDIVSHAVTVMVVQAGGAARLAETDFTQVTQSLVHIETAGRQAMVELQRLLGVLNANGPPHHGTALGERGPQPGLADLDALLGALRAAGLLVTVHTEGTPRDLDPSVDLTAYRIAQEALTNILKHADIDTNPRLRLTWRARQPTHPDRQRHQSYKDAPRARSPRRPRPDGPARAGPHGWWTPARWPSSGRLPTDRDPTPGRHRSTDTPRPQSQLPSPTLPSRVIR